MHTKTHLQAALVNFVIVAVAVVAAAAVAVAVVVVGCCDSLNSTGPTPRLRGHMTTHATLRRVLRRGFSKGLC